MTETAADLELDVLTFAVRRVAIDAGHAIMTHYTAPPSVTSVSTKDDGSPVTVADAAAEAVILPALKRLTPDIPIISEEAVAAGDIPDVGDGPFWLVDPLDGTKEYIKRNGEFTVNIALVVDGAPRLGVVFAPALGRLWAGHVGGGAIVWTAAEGTHPIKVRPTPETGLTVVGSRSHGDGGAMERYLEGRKVAAMVPRGSSLKFCIVAEGEADLYPRLAPTCHWDTAAGHAVLVAAGGRVETVEGAPLTYRPTPGFLNPHFIAHGGA